MARVYLETSVLSYLTSRPSRDVIVVGHQQTTLEWWETQRGGHELCVSQLVLKEALEGDPGAVEERRRVLVTMNVLHTTDEAGALAKALVAAQLVPPGAANDALHIAIAATHRVDYLLTWNCRHIANAATRRRIEAVCASHGCPAPVMGTPAELWREML